MPVGKFRPKKGTYADVGIVLTQEESKEEEKELELEMRIHE